MQRVTAVADASGVIAVHALLVIMARLESITCPECVKTNDVPYPLISRRLQQLLNGPFASTGCFQASAMGGEDRQTHHCCSHRAGLVQAKCSSGLQRQFLVAKCAPIRVFRQKGIVTCRTPISRRVGLRG